MCGSYDFKQRYGDAPPTELLGTGMCSESKTKQGDIRHVYNAGALLVLVPVYLPCEHYDNRNLVQTGS